MEKVQVIQSKLIPPIPSATYMRRSSFIKKMNTASNYRLTILQSGPGFGKTLGIAKYYEDSNVLYSWYTVTEEDDDIIPFISYLKASIRRVLPTFGETLTDLTSVSTFIKEDELHQWLAIFINELCTITEAFTIIIDDYHLVDHVFQINLLMEKLIELLPPHIRIIIAARAYPKWSNLLKLKVKDHYFEMTKEDLIFSEEEIIVYLEDYFNLPIEKEKAKEMATITEGWAIAINLMALKLSESEQSFDNMLKPIFQNLFDYLSEEVFQSRSLQEQEWLLAFAIFPIFSVQLVAEFYDEEGVFVLKKLASEHGFIQSLGEDDSYRFHALFMHFLTNKWVEIDREKFVLTHKKAANYYYERNNLYQATYHASQTKDSEFISKILVSTAAPLIYSGQFDWFLEIYQQLEEKMKEKYYPLYYFEGEVLRYQAFYAQARQAYGKCIMYAQQDEDAYYLSRSYAGNAHIFLDTIQPVLAESHLKKAIEWAERTERMKEKEKAMLKRQFAENLVNLGRSQDALAWIKKEQLAATVLREGNLDARIFLRMGKLTDAINVLHIHSERRTSLPDSHRETEVLLSLLYAMMGEADLAIENAQKGIQIGKEVKSGFIEAVGYTRAGHAETIKNPFMLYDAEKYYKTAIDIMEQLQVSRVKAEPLMGLAILKMKQGQYDCAIDFGRSALRETEKVNDDWMSGLIRISLAMIYFYQKEFEQAEQQIQLAKQQFQTGGDLFGEMVALFWLMNIYFYGGRTEQLMSVARRFSEVCIEENYLFFLRKDTMFGPFDRQIIYPLFHEVRSLLPDDTVTQSIVESLNINAYEHHPGYRIYIKSFGSLQLILGVDSLEERMWQREKAKELFLYLLLNKESYVRKEEIMQALWDNIDTKTADRNFKVAMNALLKVLEPNREARQQSFFIRRENTMYRLNPQAIWISDLDLFMKYASIGLRADNIQTTISYLLKANYLYTGTPFKEIRDSDWINQKRIEIESKYIQVLERLAQSYLQKKDYKQVIRWSEKLLKIDKTWEEAYRLVMLAYFRLQNRPQSMKWYEKCVAVLKKELNIKPMETTNELVEMIRSAE